MAESLAVLFGALLLAILVGWLFHSWSVIGESATTYAQHEVAPTARPQPQPTVRVCLVDGDERRIITIPERQKRYRLTLFGRTWDHVMTSRDGLWLYEPMDGAAASPRQEHIRRTRTRPA